MSFAFEPIAGLPDVILVRASRHSDDRGWFAETYRKSAFEHHGISTEFAQDNHSYSRAVGTLRGLHYQRPPVAQGKLVYCVSGAVFDVVVDIRQASPTFGRWASVKLSAADGLQVWVPVGFAHGFQTLEPDTHIVYKVTNEYSREHDAGIRWNDEAIGVRWPVAEPVLSPRDRELPLLKEIGSPF